MLATVTRTLAAAGLMAVTAWTLPVGAQTHADRATVAAKNTKYMAVAWEGEGYLVTENGGKSWKLVYGNAIASLPDPILRLLKASKEASAASSATAIPNPASGPVDIRFNVDEPGQVTITMHDMRGEEVLRQSRDAYYVGAHSHRLDLSSLPSGTYYYRLTSGLGSIGSGTVTVTR